MALVSRIPSTGSQISMGRLAQAMGLVSSSVKLNGTLGVARSKLSGSAAQNTNIAASGTTQESSTFGGMSSSFTY
jgi:hypothetical protein